MSLREIKGPVVLNIPTDPASLFLVRCLVEKLTQRLEFRDEEVQRMVLAVDEACTNVVRYAYANRTDERIILTLSAQTDRLEILVRDFGTPAAPETLVHRELSDIRPGGLGIHFIRSAMDEVRYETPAEGGTLLTLVKYRMASKGQTPDA